MLVICLDSIGAFGARGRGTSRSGDVSLARSETLRILAGYDGFESDAASASAGEDSIRCVRGRGGKCGEASAGRRPCNQGEEVEAWTST